jgi:hypothetical protein
MNSPTTTNSSDKILEILATGNIDQLTPKEKIEYVARICDSVGINPLTRPFEFLRFQNKTVLYASKGCADQLRKVNNISIKVTEKKIEDGVLFITVEGTDKSGRIDTDMGAINVSGLKGEALANATMKGLTKAKRRLTLSMCGLGIMDETEFESIGEGSLESAVESFEKREVFLEKNEEHRALTKDKIENEDERELALSLIKERMGKITKGQDAAQKGAALKEICGVLKFADLSGKTLDELKAIAQKALDQYEAIIEREVAKKKSAKDNTFPIDQ